MDYQSILLALSTGFGVMAAYKSSLVKNLKAEKEEMAHRWEEARRSCHEIRQHAQTLEVENAELKLKTNFEPVREKLDSFMHEQRIVNEQQIKQNDATLAAMQQISRNQEHLTETLLKIMGRIVPPVPPHILEEQEEKL
jgi:septal ring factor EnvC (AmiA/AmiB activator)